MERDIYENMKIRVETYIHLKYVEKCKYSKHSKMIYKLKITNNAIRAMQYRLDVYRVTTFDTLIIMCMYWPCY